LFLGSVEKIDDDKLNLISERDEDKFVSQSSSQLDWNHSVFCQYKISLIKTYITPHYGTCIDDLDEKIFYLGVKKMVNTRFFKNFS
jgi:hypothetical protein